MKQSPARSPGRPKGTRLKKPTNPDRVRAVMRMAKDGMSYSDIGKALNITRAGARYIFQRWHDAQTDV